MLGIGVDVQDVGGAEGAGDVAHVQADAAPGHDQVPRTGRDLRWGAISRQDSDQLSLAEAIATGSRPAGSATSMASA